MAVFSLYFIVNVHQFEPLLHINLLLLLLIAAANVSSVAISGLFTKFILEPFKKHIPLKESFYVSLISSVGNFFAPAGAGFGFRAVYLKKKYNFPYSEYISTLSGNYILVFLVNSFFGLLSLYLLNSSRNSQFGVLVLAFSVIFAVSLLLTIVKIPLRAVKKEEGGKLRQIKQTLYRITQGWNFIASHPRLLLRLVGLTVINLALTVLMTW